MLTLVNSVVSGNRTTCTFFSGGAAVGCSGGDGGGIYNTGTATIIDSTITHNTAGFSGGGIANLGTLTLTGSVVSGNRSGISFSRGFQNTGQGGGITNTGGLEIINSTINGNTQSTGDCGGGGGARVFSTGNLTFSFSTITDNIVGAATSGCPQATPPAPTVGGGIAQHGHCHVAGTDLLRKSGSKRRKRLFRNGYSQGSNVLLDSAGCTFTGVIAGNQIGVDPMLGPLQDNGGPTFTRTLLAGSPAIDAVVGATCPSKDQRGVARPLEGNGDGVAVSDIGAFERQSAATP